MTDQTKETDLEIDDIFQLLQAKTAKKSKSELKDPNAEYEDIKQKVTHLPSIQLKLHSQDDSEKRVEKKERKIRKIDDSVDSVLPRKNEKTITDRRLIKEARSKEWFKITKPEMTEDLKRDLLVLKNRKYLDPKRFYKGEKWEIPENFQVGEIVEGVGEYGGRMKRKQRGETIVDELLKNKESNEWFNKTYSAIQVKKQSGGKGYLKQKMEKRRKYH